MKIMRTLTVNEKAYKLECGDALYYAGLEAAVADVNANSTQNALADIEGAPIRVYTAENGRRTVQLMTDVSVAEQINITADLDILLSGHTLTLTEPEAHLHFGEAINCTMDGTGGQLVKNVLGTDPEGESVFLIASAAERVVVRGGMYRIYSGNCKGITGFRTYPEAGCFEMADCVLNAGLYTAEDGTAATAQRVRALQSEGGSFVVKDSQINASGSGVIVAGMVFGDMQVENSAVNITCSGGASYGFYIQDHDRTLTISGAVVEVKTDSIDGVAAGVWTDSNYERIAVNALDSKITVINQNSASKETVINASTYGILLNSVYEDQDENLYYRDHKANIERCAIAAKMTNINFADPAIGSYAATNGIFSKGGFVRLADSSVLTDSPNNNVFDTVVDGEKVWTSVFSGGIRNAEAGTLICTDTDVIGTHYGISSSGSLYVSGGLLSGFSHGGAYLTHMHGSDAYIKDATLEVGVYHGELHTIYNNVGTNLELRPRSDALAGFYYGNTDPSKDGSEVFMDHCTIQGAGGEAFVVRPAKEGDCNTLHVSNTVSTVMTKYGDIHLAPIRLNKYASAILPAKRSGIDIGIGCSFTAADTVTTHTNDDGSTTVLDPSAFVEETGELYRRQHPDAVLTGRDCDAHEQVARVVRYTEQELTSDQQLRARENIGAQAYGVCVLEADLVGYPKTTISIEANTPVTDDTGTDVVNGVIGFYERSHDGACVLENIADGTADHHAATVGQLNAAMGDIAAALDTILAMQEELMGV